MKWETLLSHSRKSWHREAFIKVCPLDIKFKCQWKPTAQCSSLENHVHELLFSDSTDQNQGEKWLSASIKVVVKRTPLKRLDIWALSKLMNRLQPSINLSMQPFRQKKKTFETRLGINYQVHDTIWILQLIFTISLGKKRNMRTTFPSILSRALRCPLWALLKEIDIPYKSWIPCCMSLVKSLESCLRNKIPWHVNLKDKHNNMLGSTITT